MKLILDQTPFAAILEKSAEQHNHICPRQILGARMGLYAGFLLKIDLPDCEKRLYTFVETNGCMLDGIVASTGSTVGRRTMYIYDFGKMAATFVDAQTHQAFRIFPGPQSRELPARYAPIDLDHWAAYVYAYQAAPQEELFNFQPVRLAVSLEALISHQNAHAVCDRCGEEITNEREVRQNGVTLCRACAGEAYYHADETAARQGGEPATVQLRSLMDN